MNKILLSVLQLLNRSETLDQIYCELRDILRDHFGCEEMIFALRKSAEDVTIHIWDAVTQQLDANLTLKQATLHPSFSSQSPFYNPQIDSASSYLIDNLLQDGDLQSYIAIPLAHAKQTIGTIIFAWRNTHGYASIDQSELLTIVEAITITLLRSQRVEALNDSLRNTRALFTTSHSLISTDSLGTVLDNVVNISAVAVGCSHCQLYVFADDSPQIKHIATYNHPLHKPLPTTSYENIMQGFAVQTISQHQPARLSKHQTDSSASIKMQRLREELEVGAMMIAPLVYRERVLGIMVALNTISQPDFDDDGLALLLSLANQAAVAIAKARLYALRERQIRTLGKLRDLSMKMQLARTVDGLLSIVIDELNGLLEPAFMAINLLKNEESIVVACTPPGTFPIGYRLPISRGLTGAVANSGQVTIVANLQDDSRTAFPPNASKFLRSLRTTVGLPLLDDGELIGVMNVAFQRVRQFDETDQMVFQAITSLIGGALQHVILLESLEERVAERNRQLIFANEELKQANVQLQELDALKNRFISDVSHELRTPLTSIGLYLDLLERRPDRQTHYLGVVRGEVGRLRSLVLDVLKIARFDSKRIETNFQELCMTDVVLREVGLHRERAEAVGIEIAVNVDPESRPIIGDIAQLAEMVTALLFNAINYTQQGKIEICLSYVPIANAMELTISDSGIGIPADEIEHVFERFYRGSNASSQAGSGLGLNLAEQVVHLHKGRIALSSVLDEGTTVSVMLPTIQNSDVTTDARQAATITTSR